MLCKGELKDPRKCIKEGKAVTNCALSFFRKVKKVVLMNLLNICSVSINQALREN